MIIENQASVTDAVVEAFARTENPRLREILLALVRHLHGFVREVRLRSGSFRKRRGSRGARPADDRPRTTKSC